jgi:hypothetical protein
MQILNMRKAYYIILISFLIISVLFTAFYFFYQRKILLSENKENKKITINTDKGKVIINDIFNNGMTRLESENGNFKEYFLEENDEYKIGLDVEGNKWTFGIALKDSDVYKARKQAENNFLNLLGINQENACNLDVYLIIPYSVSEKYSGPNYGLSFCPNGVQFEP